MKRQTAAVKSLLGKLPEPLVGAEIISTPIGPVYAAATARGLFLLKFVDEDAAGALPVQRGSRAIATLRRELESYFKGKLTRFTVPVRVECGTEFQRGVWKTLAKIPFGRTVTYQEIAKSVGSPEGFRAVGMANGANPIAIVVPCHRVINANGHLGGYGGGIARKLKLLEIEGLRFTAKGQLV